MKRRLVITALEHFAPGDVVVLTGFARDLVRAHGDRYEVLVATGHRELWAGNPHVRAAGRYAQGHFPDIDYLAINYGPGLFEVCRQEPVHYVTWAHRDCREKLGLEVPVTRPHGDIHLQDSERRPHPSTPPRYWAIFPGSKSDMPTKAWPAAYWQQLVHTLKLRGIPCVQVGQRAGGPPKARNLQPDLHGTVDLTGRTNLREVVRLAHHAEGVICHVSFPMHLAAALGKPCVVLGGGRENACWEAYQRDNPGLVCPDKLPVPHRYLHTLGLLDCSATDPRYQTGCHALSLDSAGRRKLCCHRETVAGQTVPLCLAMIEPEHALEAVVSYYQDGTLLPIAPSPRYAARLAGVPEPAPEPPRFLGQPLEILAYLREEHAGRHDRFLRGLFTYLAPQVARVHVLADRLPEATRRILETLPLIALHELEPALPSVEALHQALARCELVGEYALWLEDGTLCDRDARWLEKLAEVVAIRHPEGCRVFGPKFQFTLAPSQQAAVRQAPWYRGRPLRDLMGQPALAGRATLYAPYNFAAFHVPTLRALGLPDRATQHGAAWVNFGEALWQNEHGLGEFSTQKSVVNWDAFVGLA
jgi:hypothetical protein